jgi:hypothetical protein
MNRLSPEAGRELISDAEWQTLVARIEGCTEDLFRTGAVRETEPTLCLFLDSAKNGLRDMRSMPIGSLPERYEECLRLFSYYGKSAALKGLDVVGAILITGGWMVKFPLDVPPAEVESAYRDGITENPLRVQVALLAGRTIDGCRKALTGWEVNRSGGDTALSRCFNDSAMCYEGSRAELDGMLDAFFAGYLNGVVGRVLARSAPSDEKSAEN